MKTVLAALALLVAVGASPLVGQGDDGDSRQTLAGLRGVYIRVGRVNEDAQRHGLSETQLQTDNELKLRLAGIKVLAEEARAPGRPYLLVIVSTLPLSSPLSGVYAYSAEIDLIQTVCLSRTPSLFTLGRTWNAPGVFGTVGQNNLVESVRKDVRDLTDQFINAYLAANPKR